MQVLYTNMKPEDETMENLYNMYESDDRGKMKDEAGTIMDIKFFAVYEDENYKGDTIRLASIMREDGAVFTTNSPSFIRSLIRINDLCTRAKSELKRIEIYSDKGRSGREFINCKLA